jgi:hypothetical protein
LLQVVLAATCVTPTPGALVPTAVLDCLVFLQAIDHDCNDIPDAAMTLAVAALFANG